MGHSPSRLAAIHKAARTARGRLAKFHTAKSHLSNLRELVTLSAVSDCLFTASAPSEEMPSGWKLWRKDVIRVGEFIHPKTGKRISVTPERCRLWVEASRRIRGAGNDIELVLDHGTSARDVIGYERGLEFDGKTVYATLLTRDAHGAGIVQRCRNVSVGLTPDYIDGSGSHFGEAIAHHAVCQQPVVNNQKDFVLIAA